MNNKQLGLTFLLLTCFSAISKASLLEVDYLSAGDKLLTRDTVSNLEWLDLTRTINISHTEMLTELDPGGRYEGFKYAVVDDIDTLQVNAGLQSGLFSSTR